MNLVFDTDVVVDYLRGKPETREFLDKQPQINVTSPTIGELQYGAAKSGNRKHVKEVVELTKSTYVLPFAEKEALVFGGIKAELEKTGRLTSDFDIAIAATCIANDKTLITRNPRHYMHISGLKTLSFK
jgi:tRNA(fMet)-specific endonuclease VapC